MADEKQIDAPQARRIARPVYKRPMPRFEWKDSPFEGYARKYVKKHFWRVKAVLFTEEDALQQAALVFARCRNAYEGKVDNPAWFMSLFKIALVNEWHSLAVADSATVRCSEMPDGYDETVQPDGPLAAAVAGASNELRTFLRVLGNAPAEFLDILLNYPADHADAGEADSIYNQRIKRLIGISGSSADIVSEVRAILG